MECVGVPPAEDLDRDYVRVPKPKQRTRGAFKCPSCGLSLQAVLKHELTTVQCECSRIFCVRLPPKKGGGGRPSSNHLAPLRSILKPKSAKAANEEDDARSCSSSSRSVASSQFVVASASSVSSVHVASAPSVVSVDSFDSSRLRECDRLHSALAPVQRGLARWGDELSSAAASTARLEQALSEVLAFTDADVRLSLIHI